MDGLEFPVLRPVEAFPVESQGQKVLCLRDPEHVAENLIFLQPAAVLIVSLMDGNHSLKNIQAVFGLRTRQTLDMEQLVQLVEDLDRQLFLDSPRFRKVRQDIEDGFRNAPVRPTMHAGKAYEGDAEALRARLDSYMPPPMPRNGSLRGVISPHIDYTRGGPCYGEVYRALQGSAPPDLVVILGTCHAPMKHLFTGSLKHFETPIGTVETDVDFMQGLVKRYGPSLMDDERAHRTEHSIELQTVFLRHVLPGVRIAPILVGSFHHMVAGGTSPWDTPQVQDMVGALQAQVADSGKRVCFVAAADLAHIGTRFGDTEPASDSLMAWVDREDRGSLDAASAVDAEAWFASNAKDGDRRRVCGLSPIYTFLRVLGDDVSGRLLRYQQCNEPTGSNNVTIAGMAYFEKGA